MCHRLRWRLSGLDIPDAVTARVARQIAGEYGDTGEYGVTHAYFPLIYILGANFVKYACVTDYPITPITPITRLPATDYPITDYADYAGACRASTSPIRSPPGWRAKSRSELAE